MQKRLKVLLVAPTFYGAIGILARYMVRHCPSIDFFMLDISEASMTSKRFACLLAAVDVVHWLANLSTAQLPDPALPANLPCPSVASVHHLAINETDKVEAASQADAIHVSCHEWLNAIAPLTQTPVCLAYYPVDLKRFQRNRSVSRPRRPFRVGFLGVGSLFTRKRLDVLLAALSTLEKAGEAFQLWAQGLYWPDVAVAGQSVHLFKFMPVHQSWRIYSDLDVYVCTSDAEGGPLTVLEALASRVPVISTRVGLAPEVLAYGGGLLIDKDAPDQLAAALTSLIHDPQLYQRLQAESLPAVEQFLSSIEAQYQMLYMTAVESWQRKHGRVWGQRPAQPAWRVRLQRFFAIGRDLFREAKNMQALGQPGAFLAVLWQMINPFRFFC